jgi:hypothetical protein
VHSKIGGKEMSQKPYRVLVDGVNYLLVVNDKPQKLGFFTTRWVLADGPASAEASVLQAIRDDPKLKGMVLNTRDDPPELRVKEVSEDESVKPATGFAFYLDDETD